MALGCIAAGGSLGYLIPPSILFVLYGMTAEESVGRRWGAQRVFGEYEGLTEQGLARAGATPEALADFRRAKRVRAAEEVLLGRRGKALGPPPLRVTEPPAPTPTSQGGPWTAADAAP